VLFSTTRGQRIELPDYGVPDQVFSTESSVDTSELAAAVNQWEPRATALVHSTVIDESLRHVLVALETSGSQSEGRI
jgi:phage baseplate assembly protein W